MSFHILSVDDEMDMQDLLQQKFRRQLKEGTYIFYFAHNGMEALNELEKNPQIDMVLADINMPEMDGLSLLSQISKLERPLLKVVMISAYGDMRNIRDAMNRGAYDFINKPIDFNDLEATINKTREEIYYLQIQQTELDRLSRLESELIASAEIQKMLLPDLNGPCEGYPNLSLGSFIQPARFVGGDFYGIVPIDDHRLGFFIADVSGKGIIASSFMLMSHTAVSIFAREGYAPDKVLQSANKNLAVANSETMFTTSFYGIIDSETGLFSYSNAGHNLPYIVLKNSVEEIPPTHNIALGIMENAPYSLLTISLNPGDKILLFTDGVTEAQNIENELFGEERLLQLLGNNKDLSPQELNKVIFKALNDFKGKAEQFDDITLLGIQWNGN